MAARVEMPFAVNAVWQKKERDNSKNKWSEIDVSRPTFWFTLSVPLFFLGDTTLLEDGFLNWPPIITSTCMYVINCLLLLLTSAINSGVKWLTLKATATFNSSVQVFAHQNNQTTLLAKRQCSGNMLIIIILLYYGEIALARETEQDRTKISRKCYASGVGSRE